MLDIYKGDNKESSINLLSKSEAFEPIASFTSAFEPLCYLTNAFEHIAMFIGALEHIVDSNRHKEGSNLVQSPQGRSQSS